MLCVSNATYTVCKKHSNTHVSSPCPLFSKLWGVSRSKNIQQCNVKVGWYPSVQNAATSLPSPVHYTRHVSKLPMHSLPLPGGKAFLQILLLVRDFQMLRANPANEDIGNTEQHSVFSVSSVNRPTFSLALLLLLTYLLKPSLLCSMSLSRLK